MKQLIFPSSIFSAISLPCLTALFMACAGIQADAAVLAVYNFTGASAASSDADLDSAASAMAITQPTGTAGNWGFSSLSNNAFARSQAIAGNTVGAAITAGNYFSFTVTPNSGFEMDLTTLTFDSFHNNTSSSGTAANGTVTMNFFIRSSVDSYASNVGSVFTQAYNTTTAGRSVNLSGLSFQDLASPITFRLYVHESTDVTTLQGARWDNVVLNGTLSAIPIPEPSTVLLGSFGLLALLRRQRA